MALRTINEVDYEQSGIELKIQFTLQRESQLWIFTRCFVNKDINESENFDIESINNGSGEIFNKYTTVILISKEADSNKSFISFGTYYENEETGEKIFKTFAKRQLIDYERISLDNNYPSYDNNTLDICEYNIYLMDLGKENLNGKVFINSNKIPNDVGASFFYPTDKRAKVMIAGSGQCVEIKGLKINCFNKDDDIFKENKACNCCNIF